MTKFCVLSAVTLVVLLATLFEPGLNAADGDAVTSFSVEGPVREIPGAFFGVHDAVLFSVGKTKEFTPPDTVALIKDVGFEVLRGPDGTGANYYLWKEGKPINSKDSRYEKYYGAEKVGMMERINIEPGYPPLLLEDIYKPANELGLPYVFDVNVSSQSVEEIAEQVRAMRKATDKPLLVELGNELYAIINETAFPKPKDYIQKVREIHAALKKIDSSIRIGVVGVGADLEGRILSDPDNVVSDPKVDMETTQRGRVENWNPSLRQNPDTYDAITVHISPPVNGPMEKFTRESLMQYLFAFNESSEAKLRKQAASFPGKEIWVTEWGFLPTGMLQEKGEKMDRYQFLKTPGMAVARGDRLLSMSQVPGVTVTCYHDLMGGNGFGVAQREKGENAAIVKLPTYHVFKAIGGLLRRNPVVYEVKMDGGPREAVPVLYTKDVVSLPLIAAYGFGDKSGMSEVVFINRSNVARKVVLPGKQLKAEWVYGGEDPLPDFLEYPGKYFYPPRVNPEPELPQGDYADTVELKPYSMTICRVK